MKRLGDGRRGQSVVVGTSLVLLITVLVWAGAQATMIPAQNKQAEFDHSTQVQSEFQTLGEQVVVAGSGQGSTESVQLTLGTDYQSRMLFVNPGPVTGQLRTTQQGQIVIENAQAPGETGDFWNGSPHSYPTRGLSYSVDYNVLQTTPTLTTNTRSSPAPLAMRSSSSPTNRSSTAERSPW